MKSTTIGVLIYVGSRWVLRNFLGLYLTTVALLRDNFCHSSLQVDQGRSFHKERQQIKWWVVLIRETWLDSPLKLIVILSGRWIFRTRMQPRLCYPQLSVCPWNTRRLKHSWKLKEIWIHLPISRLIRLRKVARLRAKNQARKDRPQT